MSSLKTISEQACFGGIQGIYSHPSSSTGTTMKFSLFRPPQAKCKPVPVLWFLSGLTCTEENFTIKAGAQQYAATHGLMLVAPDTSPRGLDLPGEHDDYDFGSSAGFYVNATEMPWSDHYNMYSYVTEELPDLVFGMFAGDKSKQGIFGHSMGGHGALICALRNPDLYRSVSAFSPICAPTQCAWGIKALAGYLGVDNDVAWQQYDACKLINSGARTTQILVDQGTADLFLPEQLKPNLLVEACEKAGIPLELRMQDGYDHSYFFIATFVGDHIEWHARALNS
jgi:S-formylglutathione hydrolase